MIINVMVELMLVTFLHIALREQVPEINAISKSTPVSLSVAHPLHGFTVVSNHSFLCSTV